MAYTALYRKWRPQGFSEVRGQDHVVKTLKNQLLSNRVGHAYLFTGTRGTGKTTVAKIFARAVNCEHPKEDGSPCNECAVCKAVLSGSSVNVVEIDAASNNGVDNIREIREEVKYRPTEGRYRVYIIDEVHMLSAGAFNALLKTLEEPPEYVIFILATTEVHRIPITVRSRCQRYDFRRLSFAELSAQVRDIFRAESVDAEEEAISYIEEGAHDNEERSLIQNTIKNKMVAALLLGKLGIARERDITLTLTKGSALEERSAFLPSRDLVTIIGNLIENAFDSFRSVPDREHTVSVYLQEGEALIIMVDDNGCGMTEETIERVLQGSYTSKGEGHGVGLGLIRNIVDSTGGTLEIISDPGEGTSITVTVRQKRTS